MLYYIVIVVIGALIIGIVFYTESKSIKGHSVCVETNSTKYMVVLITCPQFIDASIESGVWEINTFGEGKVYMVKKGTYKP